MNYDYSPKQSNDTINKKYDTCGCIIVSELDILENLIQDKYLQLCKIHYNNCSNKSMYHFNKKINKYILNSDNKQITINYTKSYENLQGIISKNYSKTNLKPFNNSSEDLFKLSIDCNDKLLQFGKYKNKTYEYVYYNDKLYCYNLAFWNHKEFKNKKIINFINYIKNQIIIESI